ncbi:unnamed protein product [Callosobruchus maculatus]|uniref:Uncharacterized protein n=1 Tax=Callosobruchus maculatus TaxID=64391 RepID=A0A653CBW1_CALMS|nr:unnamed protein product [Callosobruchus maculatus]
MRKLVVLALSCYIALASTKCLYPKPATNLFVKSLKPVHFVSDKCWRTSTWFWYFKPDLTLRPPAIYFDESNTRIDDVLIANILALQTQYYIHYNNTGSIKHNLSCHCHLARGMKRQTIGQTADF